MTGIALEPKSTVWSIQTVSTAGMIQLPYNITWQMILCLGLALFGLPIIQSKAIFLNLIESYNIKPHIQHIDISD